MKAFALCTVVALAVIIFSGCSSDKTPTHPSTALHASFRITGTPATPAALAFTSTSENADSLHWDFGDGRTSDRPDPIVIYFAYGRFDVTLIATQSSSSTADTARQTLIITPGTALLDSIRVDQIPFTNAKGFGWDSTSGPDLFFTLEEAGEPLASSAAYNNIFPDYLPVKWYITNGLPIQNMTENYSIILYDDDGPAASDSIGAVSFTMQSIADTAGYTPVVTLHDSLNTVRITLTFVWI
jgi:PKD repeat protein